MATVGDCSKMPQKRSAEEMSLDEPTAKAIKLSDDAYTYTDFITELKDTSTSMSAIYKFTTSASKYPDISYDLVAHYCENSNDFEDLFSVLFSTEKNCKDAILVFDALRLILIRIASDLNCYRNLGNMIAQKLLTVHLEMLENVCKLGHSHVTSAIKLLTTIVVFSETTAKLVITNFPFDKPDFVKNILSRRNKAVDEDARTCFFHFISSFLVTRSDAVISELITKHQTIVKLMFEEMAVDKASSLKIFLPLVLEKIVKNDVIGKGPKVKIFKFHELTGLVTLYNWIGPEHWKKVVLQRVKVKKCDSPEELDIVRKCTHELLLELLTSPRNGIIFFNKSFRLSCNRTLQHILEKLLKKPFLQDPLMTELIWKAFQVCPEQIQPFFQKMQKCFNFKDTSNFLLVIEFFKKVLECQPDILTPLKTFKKLPLEKLAEMVFSILIPPSFIIKEIECNLKNRELHIRHVCLDYIFTLLKKLSNISNYCTSGTFLANTTVYSKADIEEFHSLFRAEMKKLLPSTATIYQCWIKMDQPKPTETDTKENYSDKVDPLEHVALSMQIFCLYQSLMPSSLSDATFGEIIIRMQKLFNLWKEDKETTEEDDSGNSYSVSDERNLKIHLQTKIKLYFFKIFADIGLRWTKINDLKQAHIYIILDLLVTIRDPQLLIINKSLVCQLLYETGFFAGLENEILIWLDWLVHFSAGQEGDTLLQFVSNLFMVYISNPYTYIDQVINVIAKAPKLGTEVSENDKLSTSDLDAVLENFNEAELNAAESETVVADSIRLPFSPLIIIASDLTKEIPASKNSALKNFLRFVLLDLFHAQSDPLALCSFVLNKNIKDLWWMNKRIVNYIRLILPDTKLKIKTNPVDLETAETETFSDLFKTFYRNSSVCINNEKFIKLLLDSLNSLNVTETFRAFNQNLFYIKVSLSCFAKGTEVLPDARKTLELYFKIIKKILNHLFEALSKDSSVNPLEQFALKDFEIFQMQKTPVGDLLKQVIDVLSSQSSLLYWFFFLDKNSSESKYTSETCSFIKNLVTDELVQIFCLLSKVSSKKKQILPEVYSLKILQSINNLCQQSKKKGDVKADELSFIFRNLSDLVDTLDFIIIQKIITTFVQSKKNRVVYEDSLNISGETLMKLLNHLLTNSKDVDLEITNVNIIFHLLKSSKLLMGLFTRLLLLKPYYCLVCSAKTFKYFLTVEPPNYLNLVQILMKFNPNLDQVFVDWILEDGLTKDFLETYLEVCISWCQLQNVPLEGDKIVCLKKISKIYRKYLSKWMNQLGTEPEDSSHNTKCHKLLQEFTRLHVSGLKHFVTIESFKEIVDRKEVLTIEQLRCILLNVQRLENENSEMNDIYSTRLEICIKSFINSLNRKSDGVQTKQLEAYLLSLLDKYLKNVSTEQCDVLKATWSSFIQSSLRFCFTNPVLLQILVNVLPSMYCKKNKTNVSPTLKELHQMLIYHSEFMNIMMEGNSGVTKELLLDIILSIMEMEPECCVEAHLNIFFGAYGATLSLQDQKLLKIISLYEKNGINLNKFRPYLWGTKFMEVYAMNRDLQDHLKIQGSVTDVLNFIDKNKMMNSVSNFPLERKLCPSTILPMDKLQSLSTCYDPSFLLPMFSYILAPENQLECLLFIEKNCFNFCIIALSCYDDDLRAAAYHALFHFKGHLISNIRFYLRDQFLYVLRFLKNSVIKDNARIPFVTSLYLVRVCQVILNKGHDLYFSIIGLLTVKPFFDLYTVPEFSQMFNCSSLMHYRERKWMLFLLHDGLRGMTEHKIYQRRHVFKIIMSYANSSLCDGGIQEMVLRILMQACTEKTAILMTREYGILTWINSFVSNVDLHSQLTVLITKLVDKIWHALQQKNKSQSDDKDFTLPKPFFTEMQILLLNLLDHFREESAGTAMKIFLPLFSSVMEHKKRIQSQEERTVSSTDKNHGDSEEKNDDSNGHDEEADKNPSQDVGLITQRDILLLLFQSRQLMQSTHIFQQALDILKLKGYNCSYLTDVPKKKMVSSTQDTTEETDMDDSSSVISETDELNNMDDVSEAEQIELTKSLINICLAWKPSVPITENAKLVLTQTLQLVISWLSHEVCHKGTIILLHDVLLWIDRILENCNSIIPDLLTSENSTISVRSFPENLLVFHGGIISMKVPDNINQMESRLELDSASSETIQKSQKLLAKLCKILTGFEIQNITDQPVNYYPFLDKVVNTTI
ncbi:nucleolar pre-ribosomal-associated protein 1 [Octopus sinensis]|uniref:Nucleolar pre-ribosomal-associated protein 1 n=1 Tax=Octopus sinensis TaxID=2607531 RepID=A0A6P7S6R8_9MOLL|nr:nucleolar pre-ribosomal-associated protein 1 [Octopus sinensis]